MYVTMREIGEQFKVSSHVIGRWLVDIGLRTADKRPSAEAHQGGYVQQSGLQSGGYFWKWHGDKTIAALEQAGHPKPSPVSSGRLNGPFTARESGVNSYEIVNGNGTTQMWVMGQEAAQDAVRLFNLAYKHGWFGGNK